MHEEVVRLLRARRGHFRLESGHHGDLWLDLETLCLRPEPVRRLAEELAARLRAHDVEMVCGPLVEGAFVALFVASALGVPFAYSEPVPDPQASGLYAVRYRLPAALRTEVRGTRVAIVNDVINAGSAVRGTYEELRGCHATPVAVGALAVLGHWASEFASEQKLALEAIAALPNEVWTPIECPLCAAGTPLAP